MKLKFIIRAVRYFASINKSMTASIAHINTMNRRARP